MTRSRLLAWRRRPAALETDSRSWQPSRFDLALPQPRRWPWWSAGIVLGTVLATVVFAPASWLAGAVASATQHRVLLADARGSVWSGSAVLVLTGGPDSRDASALPGRLRWTLGLAREDRRRLELRLRHACCIPDQLRLRLEPGLSRWRVALPAGRALVGHWPTSWLAGLGTPFNTLQLGGTSQLVGDGLSIEQAQGRVVVRGRAELELQGVSSKLSTLDALGSYRVAVSGGRDQGAEFTLTTLQGPLRLGGSGQWTGARLRFRGEARADPGSEPMLNNLLNLLGRRQGALAILAIG